jgi:hypothetical protein
MSTKLARLTVVTALVVTGVAVAANAGATTAPLSGTQTTVNEKKGIFKMHGSLVGAWYGLSFVPQSKSATQLVAVGRERFVGCIDANKNAACDSPEPSGTINFTYTVWYAVNPTTQALVHGACLHPVVGGTGDFANARGVVQMTDTPVAKKAIRTTYNGMLTYGMTAAERVPTSARATARAVVIGAPC